tara:strand:- start:185 stop:370 length:186 start_codon:yes stop_codon:yes gene_type:complete
MRRTIKQRQELCTDVLHAVLESSDNGDLSLLEVIIDEYVYKLSDREIDELEDLLVNQFGED